ncbi:MAG TPA: PAS domain S-box protein [Longimicrobiales bacterium]
MTGDGARAAEGRSGRQGTGAPSPGPPTPTTAPAAAEVRAQRLRAAFERAPVGMAILDLDGRWLEVNARLLELLGRMEAELIGAQYRDVFHPDHHAMLHILLQRLRRRALDAYALEVQLLCRDGTAVWVNLKASRARGPEGAEDYVIMAVEEVAERRAMLEALQTAQRLQEALLCNIPDAAWLKTADGHYLAVNYAFARQCGWTRAEVVGRTDAEIWPADRAARYQAEDARVLETGRSLVVEEAIELPDGTCRWYETVKAPVRDAEGRWIGTVGVRRDITDRKRAQDALRRSEEQLRQVMKLEAVGRLAGGIAHDFNNILTAVGGHATLLLDEIPSGSPLRPGVEEIMRGVDRAASLTRQLLAFSRKQVLQPRVLDLTTVVAETQSMLGRLIGEDIELSTRAEPGLGRVRADPGQIQQVILNLAVNARDAMPGGGVLSIELDNVEVDESMAGQHGGVQPAGRYVRLSVSDTGTGIPEEIKPHIFEPFFTTKAKGTGLGLSTVYGIVKQSGGFIWVYSEPGQGTTFKIYLPRVDAAVEPAVVAQEVAALSGDETILLVEDEAAVRALARQILERKGYRVITAQHGAEALQLARDSAEPVDLLLTDLVMPHMDGRELARQLAAIWPGLRVLFMSGYTGDAIVRRGLFDPDVAFIEKPFTPAALARKVRELLDGRGSSSRAGSRDPLASTCSDSHAPSSPRRPLLQPER